MSNFNKKLSPESLISYTLQWGVLQSILFMVAGLGLLYWQTAGGAVSASPSTQTQFWLDLREFPAQAALDLGLLILVALPFLRVFISVVMFALQRDLQYVIVSTLVLGVLTGSLWLGMGEAHQATHELLSPPMSLSLGTIFLMFAGSVVAGLAGSLVGSGGGILIVPFLTILFHIPLNFASGASIIAVIATSSGAAAAYVRDRVANIRIGLLMELGTTAGAVIGSTVLAGIFDASALSIIFGVVLIISALPTALKLVLKLRQKTSPQASQISNDWVATRFKLNSSYPDLNSVMVDYQVRKTPLGMAILTLAGAISGLLGIGNGTFKVLALDTIMGLPVKVSSATSNFMIGATAAASAGSSIEKGMIIPLVAAPVAIGIMLGALIGARLLMKLSSGAIRLTFLAILVISAIQMIRNGLGL